MGLRTRGRPSIPALTDRATFCRRCRGRALRTSGGRAAATRRAGREEARLRLGRAREPTAGGRLRRAVAPMGLRTRGGPPIPALTDRATFCGRCRGRAGRGEPKGGEGIGAGKLGNIRPFDNPGGMRPFQAGVATPAQRGPIPRRTPAGVTPSRRCPRARMTCRPSRPGSRNAAKAPWGPPEASPAWSWSAGPAPAAKRRPGRAVRR